MSLAMSTGMVNAHDFVCQNLEKRYYMVSLTRGGELWMHNGNLAYFLVDPTYPIKLVLAYETELSREHVGSRERLLRNNGSATAS